jgi:hypothetical protein
VDQEKVVDWPEVIEEGLKEAVQDGNGDVAVPDKFTVVGVFPTPPVFE